MPQDARHQWVANEEIDASLLNSVGGKCLWYQTLTSDNPFGVTAQNLFTATVNLGSPRLIVMMLAGGIAIDSNVGQAQLAFYYGTPTNPTPGFVDTIKTWRGITDGQSSPTARLSDTFSTWYPQPTTLPGNHVFQVQGANVGSGGTNCRITSGFRFALFDCGQGFS